MRSLRFILIFFCFQEMGLASEKVGHIHSLVSGNPAKPVLFFIHGSPGSSEQFKKLLESGTLRNRAQMVAVDRPGFGKSYRPNKTLSVSEQAQILNDYIKKNFPDKKVILVGHSYGTAVAAKMASLPEGKFQAVYLFSAIADPEEVRNDWRISGIKKLSTMAALGENFISPSFLTCQRELTIFEDNAKDLINDWKKIEERVVVVHGEDDTAAKPKNGPFIKKQIGSNQTEIKIIKGGKHSLMDSNVNDVATLLLKEL